MTAAAVAAELGQRLEAERTRRFVGRTAELELFAARLADTTVAGTAGSATPRFSVLWIHGPGGIGKSTLLAAYDRTARAAGFSVAYVDGRRTRPTAGAFRSAMHAAADAGSGAGLRLVTGVRTGARPVRRQVILVDAMERLAPVQDWLREEFLPSLPAETLVVVAGDLRIWTGGPIGVGAIARMNLTRRLYSGSIVRIRGAHLGQQGFLAGAGCADMWARKLS